MGPSPTLQERSQTGQPPFKRVHGSCVGGFRVGVVDSFEGSFVGGLKRWMAHPAEHHSLGVSVADSDTVGCAGLYRPPP